MNGVRQCTPSLSFDFRGTRCCKAIALDTA
jgi:hypothetical protein